MRVVANLSLFVCQHLSPHNRQQLHAHGFGEPVVNGAQSAQCMHKVDGAHIRTVGNEPTLFVHYVLNGRCRRRVGSTVCRRRIALRRATSKQRAKRWRIIERQSRVRIGCVEQ
jgi:hypothetical protein